MLMMAVCCSSLWGDQEDTNPWSLEVNHISAINGYYPARKGTNLTLYLLSPEHCYWAENQQNKGHRVTVADSTGKKMKDVEVFCGYYTWGGNKLVSCAVRSLETPGEGSEWFDVDGVLKVNVHDGKEVSPPRKLLLKEGEKIEVERGVIKLERVSPLAEGLVRGDLSQEVVFHVTAKEPYVFDQLVFTDEHGKKIETGYPTKNNVNHGESDVFVSYDFPKNIGEVYISASFFSETRLVDFPLSRRLTMGSNVSKRTIRLLPEEAKSGWERVVSPSREENRAMSEAPYTDLPVVVRPVGWSVDNKQSRVKTKLLFNIVPPEGFWLVKYPLSSGGEGEIHVTDSNGKNLELFDVDFGFPKEGFFSVLSSSDEKTDLRREVLCHVRGYMMPSPGSKWLRATGYVCLPIASEKFYSPTLSLDAVKDSVIKSNGITIKVDEVVKRDDSNLDVHLNVDSDRKPSRAELVFLDESGDHSMGSERTIDIADKAVSARIKIPGKKMKFFLVTYKGYQMLKIPVDIKTGIGKDEEELKKESALSDGLSALKTRCVMLEVVYSDKERPDGSGRLEFEKQIVTNLRMEAPEGLLFTNHHFKNTLSVLSGVDSNGEEMSVFTLSDAGFSSRDEKRLGVYDEGKTLYCQAMSRSIPSPGAEWIKLDGVVRLSMATGKKTSSSVRLKLKGRENVSGVTNDGFFIRRCYYVNGGYGKPEKGRFFVAFNITGMPEELFDSLIISDEAGNSVGKKQGRTEYRNSLGSLSAYVVYSVPEGMEYADVSISEYDGIKDVNVPVSLKIGMGGTIFPDDSK